MFGRKVDVLVVSENPQICRSLESILARQHHSCVCATTVDEARHDLLSRTAPPDAIVMELPSAPSKPLALIRDLRQTERTKHTPIIITGGEWAADTAEALQLGANDFVSYPLQAEQLVFRIATHVRNRDTFRQLEQQNRLLTRLAAYDDLTALYNRRSFMQTLETELVERLSVPTGIAVFLIDLDNFKYVNDTHGHLAGDVVLQTFAKALSSCMRPSDVLGRYGGDEFCMLQLDMDYPEVFTVAERLKNCINSEGQTLQKTGAASILLTASIGIAFAPPGINPQAKALIASADNALYAAKRQGRNGFVINQVQPELVS